MYQVKDIVAVYGETCCGATLNENHPSVGDSDLISAPEVKVATDAARYHLCVVDRVINAGSQWVLVVHRAAEKPGEPNKYFAVASRQCRLVERDGKRIETPSARYVVTIQTPGGTEHFDSFSRLERATQYVKNMKEEYDEAGDDDEDQVCEWEIYKAINISEEVSL